MDTAVFLHQKKANVCEHMTKMVSLEFLKGATWGLREEWMEGHLKGDYLRLIPGQCLEDRMNWYASSRWWRVIRLFVLRYFPFHVVCLLCYCNTKNKEEILTKKNEVISGWKAHINTWKLHWYVSIVTDVFLNQKRDICDCHNISVKLPYVYVCLSSRDLIFFGKSFLFLFLFLCYRYFGTFHFHMVSVRCYCKL